MYKERKSIRLPNYDYSSEGIYFVTICTKNHEAQFGKIVGSKNSLTEIGLVARQYWSEIPNHFKHVRLDDFVIMPNHLHGILILDYSYLVSENDRDIKLSLNHTVGTRHGVSLQRPIDEIVGPCHGMASQKAIHKSGQNINQFSNPIKNSISVIINQYKSSVKRWCNKNNCRYFNWQSRFYDRIIRNEDAVDAIRFYIKLNVENWKDDDLFIV